MSTYVPIQAITLTADTATVDFTGIPQTFTDLVIVTSVANNQTSTSSIGTRIQVGNNTIDTGSNYSSTLLAGEGTGAATSGRISSSTYSSVGEILGTTGRLFPQTIQIMNYSNTTTHKTIFSRSGTSSRAEIVSSLWRSTSAINQIRFTLNSNSYVAGSTFTLYGIGSGAPKAFGGSEVRTDGTYWYHIFNSSGQFTPVQALSVDYLVVAGGGGGGGALTDYYGGGGGGAGGFRTGALSVLAQAYSITVGAGGNGATSASNNGASGSDSIFSSITSAGGGGGGTANTTASGGRNGAAGGSGGGGSGTANGVSASSGGAGNTPSTSPSQGNNGGAGNSNGNQPGGGGGGASTTGANATSTAGGNGGTGTTSSISGLSVTYAGGGGGGRYSVGGTAGTGGAGGGGAGGAQGSNGNAGTSNTGGGGGGASPNAVGALTGGNGGSGIVIVRYAV